MTYRHPPETTGRRPPATHQPRFRPPRCSAREQSPPKTAADARGAPPADAPANASADDPSAPTPTPSACPSQPSLHRALRRPLESAVDLLIAVVAVHGAPKQHV